MRNLIVSRVLSDEQVFSVIGEEGFARLVAAFYRRVPHDDILSRMYPADDLVGAEDRLREYLIFRFGGPPRYIEQRGHPRLRMRHMPFVIDQAARDRWMVLMQASLDEAQLPAEAADALKAFFGPMSQFMINRQPTQGSRRFRLLRSSANRASAQSQLTM